MQSVLIKIKMFIDYKEITIMAAKEISYPNEPRIVLTSTRTQ
jgi:hypothetical protein